MVAFAALVLLVACELEKVAIPRTDGRVALHGVLSATAPTQVVLLERTRTGSVQLVAPPFDLPDPIITDSGVPETGAVVSLTTPDGQTLTAVEDANSRQDGKGLGNYRFALTGASLERGKMYHLTAHTTKGEVLTAETTVPGGVAADVAEQRDFDRSRDTVVLEWPPAAGARSYYVRIESPFGPRAFFTDSTRIRLTGELRNADLEALPHVFVPGFPQAVTVSAVDANYYDWYRTHNDPLSGTGLINRVQGGLGVFGSLVRLRFQNYNVVASQPAPIAGTYQFSGTPNERLATLALWFTLYVESPSSKSGQPDALSGRYEKPLIFGETNPIRGVLGTSAGGHVELAFLGLWSARDTLDVMSGEIRGDTIVGTFRLRGGPSRFVRQH